MKFMIHVDARVKPSDTDRKPNRDGPLDVSLPDDERGTGLSAGTPTWKSALGFDRQSPRFDPL